LELRTAFNESSAQGQNRWRIFRANVEAILESIFNRHCLTIADESQAAGCAEIENKGG
jgi:hypothetical protein